MRVLNKTLIAGTISALSFSYTMSAQAQSISELINNSNINFNFRLRSESADLDNDTSKSALANTLRSRITFQSTEFHGLSLLVEGDNTLHLTDDFYDKDGPNQGNYDVVLDQETNQLNQAYIQYQGFNSNLKAGNQRINLDNQRHVGAVAFRQDEATFDAISVTNKAIDNATIYLALANNRNTITNANTQEDIHLLNVKYTINKKASASVYYYGIDDTNVKNSGVDFDTLGVRTLSSVGDIMLEAEFASQNKSTNTADTTSLYYNLSVAKKISGVKTKLGYEVFGSDDGKAAFSTPLGTNHKFFGWSDKFLTGNGNEGIKDLNVSAATKLNNIKLVAQLHKFDAENSNNDLGSEVGFLAGKQFSGYSTSFKLAHYFSTKESGDVDITKFWLTASAKF